MTRKKISWPVPLTVNVQSLRKYVYKTYVLHHYNSFAQQVGLVHNTCINSYYSYHHRSMSTKPKFCISLTPLSSRLTFFIGPAFTIIVHIITKVRLLIYLLHFFCIHNYCSHHYRSTSTNLPVAFLLSHYPTGWSCSYTLVHLIESVKVITCPQFSTDSTRWTGV